MWNRDTFTQTGSRIALLLGQFIFLLLCVAFVEYIYFNNILPDKEAKETYKEVNCFVISKRLSTTGHVIHRYRADFYVSYTVNATQYNRWVSGNGLDLSFSENQDEQQDILSQYSVGGNYPCYYNPEKPQLVILVLRHNWLSTFPLMLPSVAFVIVLYYFLKNLFIIIGSTREKFQRK